MKDSPHQIKLTALGNLETIHVKKLKWVKGLVSFYNKMENTNIIPILTEYILENNLFSSNELKQFLFSLNQRVELLQNSINIQKISSINMKSELKFYFEETFAYILEQFSIQKKSI